MFSHNELLTLLSIIETGSFDGAARALNITPGAISQRVKSLEEAVGQLLLQRTTPPLATEAGKIMLHMAQQVRLVGMDTMERLRSSGNDVATRVTIAINDGSLATWFLPAMAQFLSGANAMVDLRLADHAQTIELLRDGTAIAAVTSEPKPIQGCRAEPLGEISLVAIASPGFRGKYFPRGMTAPALRAAPLVLCDREDDWPYRFISTLVGKAIKPPAHYVPGSHNAVMAAELGLGWRAASRSLVRDSLETGRLVDLAPGRLLSIKLYWQCFGIKSSTLDALTSAVRCAVAAAQGT